MTQYVVTLTRNIGVGKDIGNYFNNRGYKVVFVDTQVFNRTIIVETDHSVEDLQSLEYVADAIKVRVGGFDD